MGFLRIFRKKDLKRYIAFKFDGTEKQAADIVYCADCFIRKFSPKDGLYLELNHSDREKSIVRKGDWVVKTLYGGWLVLSDRHFFELFEEIV